MKFLPYEPDQAWLLPPSVKDVLGPDHLCFFVHEVVERLDLSALAAGYSDEGQRPYAPALMVKVWLYAYCRQVTSSRRLEQRVREDLAFRFLAGGQTPHHWTLNDFRTRHRRALNDLFLQVVEVARGLGMGRLGHVAIDSTRVRANASRRRTETCRERPAQASADSAFFSVANLVGLEARGIEGYVPDAHLSGELQQHRGPLKTPGEGPEHCRRRERLRSPAGKVRYRRRQALVEPVFGILKEQRGMRKVRLRGLSKVPGEIALACTAFNLTRMWRLRARA